MLPDLTEQEQKMLTYYLTVGTYGIYENIVKKKLTDQSKAGYILRQIFPNIDYMKESVAFVNKYPLMSGTIREVVAFADMEDRNNDARIRQALAIACGDDFVSDLDNGIDTLLGERGTGLSEGQMQRIAIARAVFSESPILLLDEATSALDEQTQKRLLQNLRRMTDKTVIIVTHRPAALEICDRVIDFTRLTNN